MSVVRRALINVVAVAISMAILPAPAFAAPAVITFSAPDVAVDGPLTFTSTLYSAENEDTGAQALVWGFNRSQRIFVNIDGTTDGLAGLINTSVQLDGNVVDGHFHVTVANIHPVVGVSEATVMPSALVSGNKTMAVLDVNFTDSPAASLTKSQITDGYFGPSGSVAGSYALQSNNQLHLSGTVSDPLNISYALSGGCNNDSWSSAADTAAAAQGIDVNAYDFVSYVFNMNTNPCGSYSGLGSAPGRYTWIYGINSYLRSTAAHEWGHNIGLGHAQWLNCTTNGVAVSYSSTCTQQSYADTMSVMGYGLSNVLQLNNAVHLSKLGWLTPDHVQTVTGSSTVTINQLYSQSGITVAKVARPNNAYLWIEYRTPTGPYDTQSTGGVMFHNDINGTETQVLGLSSEKNGFTAGHSFFDYQSGATISVASTSAASATLNITFGSAPTTGGGTPTSNPTTGGTPGGTTTNGYRLLGSDGAVLAYGDSTSYGDARGRITGTAVSIVSTKTNNGYWVASDHGDVIALGDAKNFGSMAGKSLNQPIINMAVTPSGAGYWLLAKDGGVFAFGDAKFFGSTGSMKLNAPAVGIMPTAAGDGYWFVASDGGIFAFGSAPFYGSMGGAKLNRPVSGMTASVTGQGYRMVANDGGIFSFGDAQFFGSLGSAPPSSAVRAMQPTGSNLGYYMVTEAGDVYAFGDAAYKGGSSGHSITAISF